jgi:hypothetical protein
VQGSIETGGQKTRAHDYAFASSFNLCYFSRVQKIKKRDEVLISIHSQQQNQDSKQKCVLTGPYLPQTTHSQPKPELSYGQ